MLAPCVLLCSCGSGGRSNQGDREGILEATRPIPVAPVDHTGVSAGVDNVNDASSAVSAAVMAVEAANRRLTLSLQSKDTAFEEQRVAFQALLDATNNETAGMFRQIEAGHERKRIHDLVIAVELRDEVTKLSVANTDLVRSSKELRTERDALVIASVKNSTTKANEDKHSKVAIGVVGDTEDEIKNLNEKVSTLTSEIDRNQWKVNTVNWVIGVAIFYVLLKSALRYFWRIKLP